MTPEALRRRMAHGNIYPAEKIDAALGNYFRAGQPRGAARARAALGGRPGRRGARRSTWSDHGIERAVGDARAGRRRDHRRPRRRRAHPPGRPHGAARRDGRAPRRARRADDGLAGTVARAPRRAPPTARRPRRRRSTRSSASDVGRALVDVRARRERDAARARREPAVAVDASSARARSSIGCIRAPAPIDVHVICRPTAPERARSPRRPSPLGGRAVARRRRRGRVRRCGRRLPADARPSCRSAATARAAEPCCCSTSSLVVAVAAVGGIAARRVVAAVAGFLLGELVLHAAVPHVHDRRGREPARARRVRRGRRSSSSMLVDRAARRTRRGAAGAGRGRDARAARAARSLSRRRPVARARRRSSRDVVRPRRRRGARRDGRAAGVRRGRGRRRPCRARPRMPTRRASPATATRARAGGAGASRPTTVASCSAFAAQLRSAVERRALRRGGGRGRRARGGERAAHRAARGGVARPADAARVDQGVGDEPAASTTSTWTRRRDREFLETIDEETDRLNALVGNLLDMSRLQAGVARSWRCATVGLEEVVPARARRASPTRPTTSRSTCPRRSRAVDADAGAARARGREPRRNARAWSARRDVRSASTAGAVPTGVDLRVVDRGPGIPRDRTRARLLAVPAARRRPHGDGRRARARGRDAASSRRWAASSRSRTRRAAVTTIGRSASPEARAVTRVARRRRRAADPAGAARSTCGPRLRRRPRRRPARRRSSWRRGDHPDLVVLDLGLPGSTASR